MNRLLPLLLLVPLGCGPKPTDTPAPPAVQPVIPAPAAGPTDYRGLCVVSASVAWASGTGGGYARTTDGGTTWTPGVVAGAEALDFRDVQAFGEKTAYVLSAGDGDKSRIYKTTDGGANWKLQLSNPDAKGFFDAIAFWDETHGLALGDPVDGKFQLFATDDGETWTKLPADDLPLAGKGESVFAASGTCLISRGERDAWFVTGGTAARVYYSTDRGRTWLADDVPIPSGTDSAGCFSICFRDAKNGVIVGGDYKKPTEAGANAAYTTDGGQTWKAAKTPLPFRSCVAWSGKQWVAAGTSGLSVSPDGISWSEPTPAEAGPWNSVAFGPDGAGYMVGPKGRRGRAER